MTQPVLVTGGSGFIAGHCILALLDAGYDVRATLRSLAKETQVRDILTKAGMTRGDALTFVAADLTADAGWAQACDGVEVVLHVASPVLPGHVEREEDVIEPARAGTLRVLRAAADAGVRRVVVMSAFHAIGFGHPHSKTEFTESDWSPLHGPGMDAYGRSKVLAEQAAWDFVRGNAPNLELVTLCPVAVVGPVLGSDITGSNRLIQRLVNGDMPGVPDLSIPVVDVRDVAAAAVAAISTPQAAGERFLISSGEPAMPMREMASILREGLGVDGGRVPTRKIPSFVVRLAARFNPEMASVAPELGLVKRPQIDKARRVLAFSPRPARDAILEAGRSLVGIR